MSHLNKSASERLSSSDSKQSSNLEDKVPRGEVFDINPLTPRKKWKKALTAIGVVSIPLLSYGVFTAGAIVERSNTKPQPIGPFPSAKVEVVKAVVNVTGQVKKPGIYTLEENARINDAIQKAGGALPNADLNALNLAAWVEDGSKIDVPSKIEPTPIPTATPIIIQPNPAETPPPRMGVPIEEEPVRSLAPPRAYIPPSSVPSAPVTPQIVPQNSKVGANADLPRGKTKSGAESSNISTQYLLANPLDINSATASELEGLPNIGPKTAERIIAYRTSNGRFRSVEELDNVKGIGEKTLAKLKPYVVAR
jgi:competence protein ComEA